MANRTKLTLSARERLLDHLRAGNTVTAAAGLIGMRRQGIYVHRDTDPVFAVEWDRAVDEGIDVLEQEAKRRAVEGVLKPQFHQGRMLTGADGQPVEVREYSDRLLEMRLKAKKPGVYRETVSVEQKGRVRHEHTHTGRVDLTRASNEELALLERLAEKSAANGHAR